MDQVGRSDNYRKKEKTGKKPENLSWKITGLFPPGIDFGSYLKFIPECDLLSLSLIHPIYYSIRYSHSLNRGGGDQLFLTFQKGRPRILWSETISEKVASGGSNLKFTATFDFPTVVVGKRLYKSEKRGWETCHKRKTTHSDPNGQQLLMGDIRL